MFLANKTLLVVLSGLISVTCLAQQTKPVVKPVQPFKPPKVTTSILKYTDSVAISAADATQAISQPLVITDAKEVHYSLVTYQFAYKRITVSEDEQGKAYPSSDMIADRFKITPLPGTWQSAVNTNLQKGELLYFFDVTVKDAKGRLFFAPDLKIAIK